MRAAALVGPPAELCDRHIVVLADHEDRQEAFAWIRKSDRGCTRIQIEHRERQENVSVVANNWLIIDRRNFSIMMEFAKLASVFLQESGEVSVRFGADEIVDGDRDGILRLRSCRPHQSEYDN
jgi:hypothetical protein